MTIGNLLLITAFGLFGLAGCVFVLASMEAKKPKLKEPKSYTRETESEYKNLIDEHIKL